MLSQLNYISPRHVLAGELISGLVCDPSTNTNVFFDFKAMVTRTPICIVVSNDCHRANYVDL